MAILTTWHALSPFERHENMLSWAVSILILAVVAALLAMWGFAGMPGWLVRGLCLLLILLGIAAAIFI
jgi:hypothetical protein